MVLHAFLEGGQIGIEDWAETGEIPFLEEALDETLIAQDLLPEKTLVFLQLKRFKFADGSGDALVIVVFACYEAAALATSPHSLHW